MAYSAFSDAIAGNKPNADYISERRGDSLPSKVTMKLVRNIN